MYQLYTHQKMIKSFARFIPQILGNKIKKIPKMRGVPNEVDEGPGFQCYPLYA